MVQDKFLKLGGKRFRYKKKIKSRIISTAGNKNEVVSSALLFLS
jgi:hypothetical protein